MKKLTVTKSEIIRNTTSIELKTYVLGRFHEYVCRLGDKVFRAKTTNGQVYVGNTYNHDVEWIGEASDKKEFINEVYKYLNL